MEGLTTEFVNAIQEHKEHPPDDDKPRDLIDVYLTAIKNERVEESSFYKEHGG